jgi:proline dehydrogenase
LLDLTNTKIAFRSKSNGDLRRSFWLFQLISHPGLVALGAFFMRIALILRLPVEPFIRMTIFRQFCGGETIEECRPTIALLGQHGIGTILDYSVEGKDEESGLDETKREILRTIEEASRNPTIPFTVFKMTGIIRFSLLEKPDQSEEWKRGIARFEEICEASARTKVKLLIDAEESWIQGTIDHLAEEMMEKHNKEKAIVFHTLQMYRTDRLIYLSQLLGQSQAKKYFLGLKIVRGAYMEKERDRARDLGYPSPIHESKESTDDDYDEALRFSLENIDRISLCAGTHNDRSTKLLSELMHAKGLKKNDPRIYFSQLLGMSDHLSFNLAAQGHNVAKYVPYGPVRAMVPYLTRRARENTSIRGQTSRELRLITAELQRRKQL